MNEDSRILIEQLGLQAGATSDFYIVMGSLENPLKVLQLHKILLHSLESLHLKSLIMEAEHFDTRFEGVHCCISPHFDVQMMMLLVDCMYLRRVRVYECQIPCIVEIAHHYNLQLQRIYNHGEGILLHNLFPGGYFELSNF